MTDAANLPAPSTPMALSRSRSPARMKTIGRLTGALYLFLAIVGGASYFLVSETLIVHGDSAQTTRNILANEGLFRAGVAAWLVTALIDVVLAYLFYWIFAPRVPALALTSMVFRLTYVAIHAAALTNLFDIITLIDQGAAAANPDRMLSLAEAHLNGFMVSLLFFGMHLIIVAGMIFRTGYFPRPLAVLPMFAGLAYIADTFALALLPSTSALSVQIDLGVTVMASVGEIGFLLWLLLAGVNTAAPAGAND